MKRTTILLTHLLLVGVLASCSGGESYGSTKPSLAGVPTSPKPTTTKPTKKPPTKKASPKPTKTAATSAKCPAKPVEITIKSLGGGFEPDRPVVYAGCSLRFTNKDPSNKHTFQSKDKGLWKSPSLAFGKSWLWKPIDLEPGTYEFVDQVPYIFGTLVVLAAPR